MGRRFLTPVSNLSRSMIRKRDKIGFTVLQNCSLVSVTMESVGQWPLVSTQRLTKSNPDIIFPWMGDDIMCTLYRAV